MAPAPPSPAPAAHPPVEAHRSLRRRLLLGGAVSLSLALGVAGLGLSQLFQDHLRRNFERELSHHLDQLAATVELGADGLPRLTRPLSDPRFLRPLSGLYWQISSEGVVRLRSRSLWDAVLPLPPDELVDGTLHSHRLEGPDHGRLTALERSVELPEAPRRLRLVVAESMADLEQAGHSFDRTLLVSLSLLTLVLTLAAAVQVWIGLRPLGRLRQQLAEIRAGRRKRFGGTVPTELKPLVDDLNALLGHSEEVVERARVQAGNLAHALKTGLAVIGNDVDQIAARAEAEPVARMRERLDDMRRQLEHHLGRARAAAARSLPGWRTAVAPVVGALSRTLARLHAGRELRFQAELAPGLEFAGEREDLEEILGNLMDNACKWAATTVRVSGAHAEGVLVLTVADDGPGLPPGAAEALAARGTRLDLTVPGSGLGLGIVRDLCQLYGGSLSLERADLGGLAAVVRLPRA